ncbi:MAG: DNA-binding protein [Rhodobacterales bacterium]|nr:DNA-binding protein [Rhodobacterales bacterium]
MPGPRPEPEADDWPPRIGTPAMPALAGAGFTSSATLASWREADLMALHGMGPKAARDLSEDLARGGLTFSPGP